MLFIICPNFKVLLNVFDSEIPEGSLEEKKLAALKCAHLLSGGNPELLGLHPSVAAMTYT